jgi:trimethylamine--corrinoid protein Co-methyltransferase
MQTEIQVLSEDERDQIHEKTLKVLATTGVRVDSPEARQILREAGGQVDSSTNIVRFPTTLVEDALRLAPENFTLGARRPAWDLQMNAGQCWLLPDGEALWVIDRVSGEKRLCTYQDWREATILCDALDEIGLFWSMLRWQDFGNSLTESVHYWRSIFCNFSKHVQISVEERDSIPWLLEILQVIFGDRESIRKKHPISFLMCPQSPLIIPQPHIEAYLTMIRWDIPIAAMPMLLMGGTAPGTMISTVIQGNCETLALLCLVQAAAPGTPFIYAPVLAMMNPRTGLYSGGAVENGILGSAVVEMARYYHLPVEASGGGTDFFYPGIQASYETALNVITPVLSWPDILVGPGLIGNSMILSFEQMMIDIEVFNMCARARRGILTGEGQWLDEVICQVGVGGNFLGQRSTVKSLRSGERFINKLGVHDPQDKWESGNRTTLLEQARTCVTEILSSHHPLSLDDDALKELEQIQRRAEQTEKSIS